jgi:hypothetical protein
MTLSDLQAKRELLVQRISDAVKRTTMGDRSVEYATVNEMERALQLLDSEIAAASSTRTSRVVLVKHSNG